MERGEMMTTIQSVGHLEEFSASALFELLREFSETQGRTTTALESLTSATNANTSSLQDLTVKLIHFEGRLKVVEDKQLLKDQALAQARANLTQLQLNIIISMFSFTLGMLGTNYDRIVSWLIKHI